MEHTDLKQIEALLTSTGNINLRKMTRSYVSWATPDGRVVVSGKEGILNKNFPDITKRRYYESAKQNPWKLQFADPTKSLFSTSFVLPTAMGVVDKDRQHIGYLVLGLRVEHIHQLLAARANGLSFMMFDEHGNLILNSSDNINNLDDLLEGKKLLKLMAFNNGYLSESLLLGGIEYSNYEKMSKNPYFIVTGMSTKMQHKAFLYKVAPRLCEFFFMGVFCTILLYFFRKKIIAPIVRLSQIALSISEGHTNIKNPKQNSQEMSMLAKALLLVTRSIRKNEYYKRKLEKFNELSKKSDQAKEHFMKKIRSELNLPLREIIFYSNMLFNNFTEKTKVLFTNKQVLECLEGIKKAIAHIRSKTGDSLELSVFDLNALIHQTMQINLKSALIKQIKFTSHFQADIPKICADELRLKQIFVSLLSRSIENSPEQSSISLSTKFDLISEHPGFKIVIKDQSFGLEENELNRIKQKLGDGNESEIFDLTNIQFESIEKLIAMHDGKIDIKNIQQEGRTIIIYFPASCYPHPKKDQNNVHYLNDKKRKDNIS